MRVLVIDVGGTHVKVLAGQLLRIDSGGEDEPMKSLPEHRQGSALQGLGAFHSEIPRLVAGRHRPPDTGQQCKLLLGPFPPTQGF